MANVTWWFLKLNMGDATWDEIDDIGHEYFRANKVPVFGGSLLNRSLIASGWDTRGQFPMLPIYCSIVDTFLFWV